ncbi:LytTR family transcriptional regulator DNA-binding domain-containing protein [Bacteroidales bacterium OttesenSCG-928-I21]|nr:LytTR family transcriptional regulator DNA-binding domain-containing protein [Bacteroidales bacterium OttesenSCG-928-I21]
MRIFLSDGTSVLTLLGMKTLEERLPKNIFMRMHRSFIVNLKKITVVERQRIIFDKKTYITVNEQYKKKNLIIISVRIFCNHQILKFADSFIYQLKINNTRLCVQLHKRAYLLQILFAQPSYRTCRTHK